MSDPRIHIIPKVGTDFYCHFASFRVTSSFPCLVRFSLRSYLTSGTRIGVTRGERRREGNVGNETAAETEAWAVSSVHLLHFSPSPSVVGLVRSLPLTSHPVSSGAEEKCNGTRRRWVRDGHGQPLPSASPFHRFPSFPTSIRLRLIPEKII